MKMHTGAQTAPKPIMSFKLEVTGEMGSEVMGANAIQGSLEYLKILSNKDNFTVTAETTAAVFGPFCNRFVNVVSSVLGFQNPVVNYFVRNFMKNKPG